MDRAIAVLLVLICGIAIGAGGVQMWRWSEYVHALEAKAAAIGERDELVRKLADMRAQRDKAQAQAKRERDAIYATDADAAAWARMPVPDALAQRVRNAAKAADAAASATRAGDLPEAAR